MEMKLVNILKEMWEDEKDYRNNFLDIPHKEFLFLKGITMLPIDYVLFYKEFDREFKDRINSKEYITNLYNDIKQHGLKQPLILQVGRYNGVDYGLLIEGNHRLFIAKKLGIDEVPVKVKYINFNEDSIKKANPIDVNTWERNQFLSPKEVLDLRKERIEYSNSLRK